MILDVLDNADCYLPLNKGLAKAFEFLKRPDLADLPTQRHEIDGDRVFAIVAEGPGRKKQDAMLESHRKYIDIQLVVAGSDDMGWKTTSSCSQPDDEYDPEADLQFFKDEPDSWVKAKVGMFAIFFPEDAHMPMISSGDIRKFVAKVAVDQD